MDEPGESARRSPAAEYAGRAGGASPNGAKPYLAAAGAILCWASLAASVGESLHRLRPEQVLFYGLLTAGIALTLWDGVRRRKLPPAWPGWRVVLVGVYGIWGFHTLLVAAFSLVPVVEANVLNYTWPLWIVLLGSLMPEQRRSRRAIPGGLLGFAGVAVVIGGRASFRWRAEAHRWGCSWH
ncbi:MAG: DMT family transporter [bacterium]